MTTDISERVMILGRVIYDPQRDTHGEGNKYEFRTYVGNDEGVILYNVKLGELMQIFEHDREGPEILHLANQCNQSC